MKRAKKHLGEHLAPVIVYREDIELLVDKLSQKVGENDGEVTLKTDEYEYENIEELLQNEADNLTGLSISRRKPYVSVYFDGRMGLWLYAEDDSLIAKGIFAEMTSVLKPNARKMHVAIKWISRVASWLGAIAGGVLIGAGNFKEAAFLFLLPIVSILFETSKHRSIIYRYSRAQKMSFWKRNSDQIVVALIGAFAGAAIAIAFTYLLSNGKP